jgi:hypothetical protein
MKKVIFIICGLFVANLVYSQKEISIKKGESKTLSARGGSGKIVKWYSGSCGGTLVGEGEKIKVTPSKTTTYYGRWEDGNKFSDCQRITIVVTNEQLPIIPTPSTSIDPIAVGETLQLNLADQFTTDELITWESSNPDVATVDSEGIVTAKSKGTSKIVATNQGGGELAVWNITIEKTITTPPVRRGELDLKYAIWIGEVKNGKPDGVGMLKFKAEHRIDMRDPLQRIAKAGETVTGCIFTDGHLQQGTWNKSDGNVELINLGGE